MKLSSPIRVWDIPTRLFHWLLVILIGFSWGAAEYGKMDLHRLSGSVLLGLVAFRLVWGVIGSNTARFGSFLRSPAAVFAYLRSDSSARRPGHKPGHNPVGGYSVLAMLLLLLLQIGTGLFSVDIDGLESGPLSYLVSFDQGRAAAEMHELSFTVLQIVVAIHVLAVLFYLVVRKRNLVRPMFTGYDRQIDNPAGALVSAGLGRFLIAAAIGIGLAWWTAIGMPV
jgi:cytochrome b